MTNTISIRPSKDLRNNYSQISSLSRENPVAITVNGREDIVILSHEDYVEQQNYISQLESKLAIYSHLAQAQDDIRLGRIQDIDESFEMILSKLERE